MSECLESGVFINEPLQPLHIPPFFTGGDVCPMFEGRTVYAWLEKEDEQIKSDSQR